MSRISIDDNLCMGSKECAGIAVAAVQFDDDGIASPSDVELADEIAEQLADSCPGMAITVIADCKD